MPIAYIQRTRERYAQYPPFRWVVNRMPILREDPAFPQAH